RRSSDLLARQLRAVLGARAHVSLVEARVRDARDAHESLELLAYEGEGGCGTSAQLGRPGVFGHGRHATCAPGSTTLWACPTRRTRPPPRSPRARDARPRGARTSRHSAGALSCRVTGRRPCVPRVRVRARSVTASSRR